MIKLFALRPEDSGVVDIGSEDGPLRFKKHPRPLLIIVEAVGDRKKSMYVRWVPFNSRISRKDIGKLTALVNNESIPGEPESLDDGPEKWE